MTTRFSVVTISFNQAEFLPRAIESVLRQRSTAIEVEYIVCDPGSTDGSRDIIESYGDAIQHRLFASDDGPADGLNRGFAAATGDIYCYLNSDDVFADGAFARVAAFLSRRPDVDVACGHALVIDAQDRVLRRVWSEPWSRRAVAYGAHVQIQPSTFIRADAYRRAGGFDAGDRANWDGGLLVSLHLAGALIAVIDEVLSAYRLHDGSITLSGRLADRHAASARQRFSRLMGRDWTPGDARIAALLRLAKHLRWPLRTLERLRHGPLFRRGG